MRLGGKLLAVPTNINEAIQLYNDFNMRVFKTPYDVILYNAVRIAELNNQAYGYLNDRHDGYSDAEWADLHCGL